MSIQELTKKMAISYGHHNSTYNWWRGPRRKDPGMSDLKEINPTLWVGSRFLGNNNNDAR